MSMHQSSITGADSQCCPAAEVHPAPRMRGPCSEPKQSTEIFSQQVAHALPEILSLRDSFKGKTDQRELDRLSRELWAEARQLDQLVATLWDGSIAPVARESARAGLFHARGSARNRVVTEFAMTERVVGDHLGMNIMRTDLNPEGVPASVRDPTAVKAGELLAQLYDNLKAVAVRTVTAYLQRDRWEVIPAQKLTGGVELNPDALFTGLSAELREPFRQMVQANSGTVLRRSMDAFLRSKHLVDIASQSALTYAVLIGQLEVSPALIASFRFERASLIKFVENFCADDRIESSSRKALIMECLQHDPAFFMDHEQMHAPFRLSSSEERYQAARSWISDEARRATLLPEEMRALVGLVHGQNREQDVKLLAVLADEHPEFCDMARAQRAFWIQRGEHPRSDWIPGSGLFWALAAAAARRGW